MALRKSNSPRLAFTASRPLIRSVSGPLRITLLYERGNWVEHYARALANVLCDKCEVTFVADKSALTSGDVLFYFNVQEIVAKEHRAKYKKNVVIHASDLPKDRGWSPYIHKILRGENSFPVTLCEAEDRVDSGAIYLQEPVTLEGHELLPEIRAEIGRAIVRACLWFIEMYPDIVGRPQAGEPTYCPKRGPADSRLDPAKPLIDQFDLLRCVDNDLFPAWFEARGRTYRLAITKDDRVYDGCCGD